MKSISKTLAILLSLAFAAPGFAQDTAPAADATTAPAPVEGDAATNTDLSLGATVDAPADGVGSSYVAATFDSWEQRCIRSEDGSDPCQLYQLLKDAKGNSVAEITMFGLPAGQQAAGD